MQRSPFTTPEVEKMRRDAILARATRELIRLHATVLAKMERIEVLTEEVRAHAARIKNLPQGPKGDTGERGPQGIKGKDALILNEVIDAILPRLPKPKDGENGKDGASPDINVIVSKVLARMPMPRNGRDAVINKEEIIEEVAKLIKKDLDWRKIPGLQNELASYRNQLANGGRMGDSLAGRQYGRDTFVRGGGGSGSSGTEVVGEEVSGSGTSFTLAHTPTTGTLKLFIRGQRVSLTTDYTLAGAVITTVNSWSAGDLVADYTYE